jgi:predicted DNA-binding transcriptional regulator YafY
MTPIATLPTAWRLLNAALQARRPVQVSYHGRRRIVCPHALGWHNGRAMVLGYQTGGQTSTGTLAAHPRKRWRCMYVDEIDQIVDADPDSPWQSADNYNHWQPFPVIDHIATAITPDGPNRASEAPSKTGN